MTDYLITNFPTLLNYSLVACFVFLFVWEQALPWMKSGYSVPLRWWNTISLYITNRYLLIWLIPVATIPAALYAQNNSLGLLNLLDWPPAFSILAGIVLFDLFYYWLHRVFHRIPLLWRLHRLHHSDPDVDLITELKHHPLESMVSTLVAIAVVILFGLSPLVIIIRALFAQAVSLMSHANIKLPGHIDRILRLLIITPAMHRIHHSTYQPETDSNYGTLFSFWDRLFGTYVETPRAGFEHLQLGLKEFRSPRGLWLDKMLLQPFVNNPEPVETTAADADNS